MVEVEYRREAGVPECNFICNAERGEEIAKLISSEVGTPINYSRMAMVGTPRVVARSYAKILETFEWEEEEEFPH